MSQHAGSPPEPQGSTVEVAQVLQRLRAAVESARSLPMSSSAVVNRPEVLEMIDQLEATVQGAFAESDRILAERDSFLAEARQHAEHIVADAYREREKAVSETAVYKIARRESSQLRSDAEQEASALRRETDDYVDQRLANLEIALNKTLQAVTRGRDRLQGRSDLDNLGDTDDETPRPSSD